MKNPIFTFIILLLVISMLLMYISIRLLLVKSSPDPEEVFVIFPEVNTAIESGLITLITQDGEVQINDVRSLPNVIQMSNARYEIRTPDADEFFNPFTINFAADSGTFAISLSEEPLAETRRRMEVFLQNILGISSSDMCKLKVYVGVNVYVNEYFSGKNLGFSFCPGSVALD